MVVSNFNGLSILCDVSLPRNTGRKELRKSYYFPSHI